MSRKAESSYETENSVFSQRLKKIMKERGENQTTLAKKITECYITIQRQTISLYMNGQSKPDTERLAAISRTLDVSADWLLGLSDERAINGDVAQAARYTGLSVTSISKLHESAESSWAHTKALLRVIEQILQERPDDFTTWAWRSAMASCAIDADNLAATRHNADIHLVEIANSDSGEIATSIEVPLSDYEYICTSTAIGIIQESADKSLKIFKDNFKKALRMEKFKE